MGLPTTWITLSLVHLFWGKVASSFCGQVPQPFRLCGDDLIGFFSKKMVSKYHAIIGRCGG